MEKNYNQAVNNYKALKALYRKSITDENGVIDIARWL